MTIIKTVFMVVVMILVIDFVCFSAWVVSGQKPQDNFYAGAITANFIKATLK